MSWDVSFTCDICGRKKGDANHWWMVVLGDVPCFEHGQPRQRFTLMPWNAAESRNAEFYHMCGQGCAMQAMERFMTNGALLHYAGEPEAVASNK
jgi:hypothetical protein